LGNKHLYLSYNQTSFYYLLHSLQYYHPDRIQQHNYSTKKQKKKLQKQPNIHLPYTFLSLFIIFLENIINPPNIKNNKPPSIGTSAAGGSGGPGGGGANKSNDKINKNTKTNHFLPQTIFKNFSIIVKSLFIYLFSALS